MRKTYSNSSRSASAFEDDDLGEQPGFLSEQEEPRARRSARDNGRDNGRDSASRYDLPAAAPRSRRGARETPDRGIDYADEGSFDFDSAALSWQDEPEPASVRGSRSKLGRRKSDQQTRLQWMMRTTLGRWVFGLLTLMLLCVLAAASWGIREFLRTDPHFRIATSDQIAIEGNQQVGTGQARAVFGEDIGRNLFFVPIRLRQQQLEQLPWVEHASVERLLPNRLRVRIAERTPIAFAQNGDRVLLIDRHGALLDLPAGADSARLSFPVLDGMGQDVPPAVRQARMGLYLSFIHDLDSHGEKVSARLSEVDLADPDDTVGVFDEDGKAISLEFGDHNFFERYQIYQTHLAEWQQQYPRLVKVNLRNAPQVNLSMDEDRSAGNAGDAKPAAAASLLATAPPVAAPASALAPVPDAAAAAAPPASAAAKPAPVAAKPAATTVAGHKPAARPAARAAALPAKKPARKVAAKHPQPAARVAPKQAQLTPEQQIFKNQPPRPAAAMPATKLAPHPAALPKSIAPARAAGPNPNPDQGGRQ